MVGRMPELMSSAGAETGEISEPSNISSAGSLMGVSSAGAGPEVVLLAGSGPEVSVAVGPEICRTSGAGPEVFVLAGSLGTLETKPECMSSAEQCFHC